MARGGKLGVNIDFLRLVNDEKAALRGTKEGKGGGHTGAMTGAMVATAIVVWPAAPLFLFMHGKDITIPKGTEITAYVNGEIRLDPAKFAALAAAKDSSAGSGTDRPYPEQCCAYARSTFWRTRERQLRLQSVECAGDVFRRGHRKDASHGTAHAGDLQDHEMLI
jgi:hypothetical protein